MFYQSSVTDTRGCACRDAMPGTCRLSSSSSAPRQLASARERMCNTARRRTGRRLIEEDERRVDEHLACERQPPLLATGDALDEDRADGRRRRHGQADSAQHLVHQRLPLRRRLPQPACAPVLSAPRWLSGAPRLRPAHESGAAVFDNTGTETGGFMPAWL